MTAGWGVWGVYRLWLLAHVRENKGGSPECRPPVDFELLLWLLEGSAGVFNQISSEGRCLSNNAVFVDCEDGARVRKLISCTAAAAYSDALAALIKCSLLALSCHKIYQ